jgi:hypothetical protein
MENIFSRRDTSRGIGSIDDHCSEIEDEVVVHERATFSALLEILCIGPGIEESMYLAFDSVLFNGRKATTENDHRGAERWVGSCSRDFGLLECGELSAR